MSHLEVTGVRESNLKQRVRLLLSQQISSHYLLFFGVQRQVQTRRTETWVRRLVDAGGIPYPAVGQRA